ncbi:MAG: hypothetical protein HC836_43800 [Richelia sp. RM2_1_2]|nr:hypothetical protein [Richelia sp. RM2_1_2]
MSVKEIISEYDELHRLAKWKNEVLNSGKNHKKYHKEIERINGLLEENGYFIEMSSLDDLDKEMREYFKTLQ